jgi:hypothetical protein
LASLMSGVAIEYRSRRYQRSPPRSGNPYGFNVSKRLESGNRREQPFFGSACIH